MRLVNNLVHLLRLLQLVLILRKLYIATCGRLLHKTWQVSRRCSRDRRHVRLVNVEHLLSRTRDWLWLSLDVDMLLTGVGHTWRLLSLRHQCYEFIADWWGTIVALLRLGLFNIIRHN